MSLQMPAFHDLLFEPPNRTQRRGGGRRRACCTGHRVGQKLCIFFADLNAAVRVYAEEVTVEVAVSHKDDPDLPEKPEDCRMFCRR